MGRFKIGNVYHNNKHIYIKIISKRYLYLIVSSNITHEYIYKDYVDNYKISYNELKKDWTLSIKSILKQL